MNQFTINTLNDLIRFTRAEILINDIKITREYLNENGTSYYFFTSNGKIRCSDHHCTGWRFKNDTWLNFTIPKEEKYIKLAIKKAIKINKNKL